MQVEIVETDITDSTKYLGLGADGATEKHGSGEDFAPVCSVEFWEPLLHAETTNALILMHMC